LTGPTRIADDVMIGAIVMIAAHLRRLHQTQVVQVEGTCHHRCQPITDLMIVTVTAVKRQASLVVGLALYRHQRKDKSHQKERESRIGSILSWKK
jgi:hypothetical protein